MSYEIIGKLTAKYETVQRTESFKTREFVIEKSDDIGGRIITNYAKFQCVQDRTAIVDRFNVGDEVKVSFNIKGTKWVKDGKENYITNLDAWRIESVKIGQDDSSGSASSSTASYSAPPSASATPSAPVSMPAAPDDDLPF